MFYIYVLRNNISGKIYIGQTLNLEKRIEQHNDRTFDKKSFTHLNKGEWKLVYKEEKATRKEALLREKELKSYRGREFIKKIIGSVAQR